MRPAGNSGPNGAASKEARPSLKYQRRSIWISTLYLPLLVIPWAITCVMMFRPVRQSSYGDHVGTDLLTDPDVREMERWLMAAKVMSTISTVLGLPVISALLAQAAVRYSQRQREGQTLNLAQLFALANRGWADLPVLFRAWENGRSASSLLRFGGLLVFITLIQPPIQSLMIRYEPISIATCHDVPGISDDARGIGFRYGCGLYDSDTLLVERQSRRWYDPDPGDLENQPQGPVVSKLASKLDNIRESDFQTHLWPENAPGVGYPPPSWPSVDELTTLSPLAGIRQPGKSWSFYASSLPSGTTTGVLRYHAMRQHSTARCDNVSQSTFPTTCAGISPITATFALAEFTVRICVPGASNQTAWTRSRNRQSIDEELWIGVQMNQTWSARVYPLNFTTHCTSSSTRGYFELGNLRNGNTPGPLLEKWPDKEELAANFNDATGFSVRHENIPAEEAQARGNRSLAGGLWDVPNLNTVPPSPARLPTPGPLMTSALALFGDTSFFFTAANATKTNYVEVLSSICRTRAVPLAMFLRASPDFWGFCYREDDAERAEIALLQLIAGFIFLFSDTSTAKTMLDVSMFGANEILLTTTASSGGYAFSRAIYWSNGYEILKPVKSIPGIAVVSILLGLQAIAVVLLVVYNSSLPTWTASLDALVMAKLGTELKGLGLAPLGVHDKHEEAKLVEADGVVGLVQVDKDGETDLKSESQPVLGLGGSGVVTRTALSDKSTKDSV